MIYVGDIMSMSEDVQLNTSAFSGHILHDIFTRIHADRGKMTS